MRATVLAPRFRPSRFRILLFVVGVLSLNVLVKPGAAQISSDAPATAEFTRLVRAGELLAKAGNYVGAIEHYNRALALGAPSPLAESALLTYRAGAYSKQGKRDDAIRDHDTAIKVDPNAFALWARAETLRKFGRLSDALVDYDAAIRINPGDSDAYAGRADALSKLGRLTEAKT